MDSFMLRDEAAKERIRLAEEFLDPRGFCQQPYAGITMLTNMFLCR